MNALVHFNDMFQIYKKVLESNNANTFVSTIQLLKKKKKLSIINKPYSMTGVFKLWPW